MLRINQLNQMGYSILSVILFIVIIIISVALWLMAGNSNIAVSSNQEKVLASSLISDGAKLKLGYDKVLIAGYKYNATDFNNKIAYSPNSLNPSNILNYYNGVKQPDINLAILRDNAPVTEGVFIYADKNFKGNIGTSANDPTFIIFGIKDNICKAINQSVNNTYSLPSMAIATEAAYAIVPSSYANYDLTSLPEVKNWTSGCISTQPGVPDHGMYFVITQVL